LAADEGGMFSFVSPKIYNEALALRKSLTNEDRPLVTLLSGTDKIWSYIIISDLSKIDPTTQSFPYQDINIDQIVTEVSNHQNQSYIIFDPLVQTVILCNQQMTDLLKSNNVTIFPQINRQDILETCKLKNVNNNK
jgi:hypothetical protein